VVSLRTSSCIRLSPISHTSHCRIRLSSPREMLTIMDFPWTDCSPYCVICVYSSNYSKGSSCTMYMATCCIRCSHKPLFNIPNCIIIVSCCPLFCQLSRCIKNTVYCLFSLHVQEIQVVLSELLPLAAVSWSTPKLIPAETTAGLPCTLHSQCSEVYVPV